MAIEHLDAARGSGDDALLALQEAAAAAVADLGRGVKEAAAAARGRFSDAALTAVLAGIDVMSSQVKLQQVELLGIVKQRGSWATSGGSPRNLVDWRQGMTRQGRGKAMAEEEVHDAISLMPQVLAAVETGELTYEHAEVVGGALGKATPKVRERLIAEADEIVRLGREVPVPVLRKKMAAAAAALESELADRAFEATRLGRYLRVSNRNGGVKVEGFFDPVAGEKVRW